MSNRLRGPGRLTTLPPGVIGPPPPERPEPAPRRSSELPWWVIACALTVWSAQALIAWAMLRR
jgi:hypothetical protein